MNWYHKILLTLSLFVSMLVYFAYKSSQARLDLVTENYYQAEIGYQDKIDREQNAVSLSERVQIEKRTDKLIIQFPPSSSAVLNGKVKLYFPADKRKDEEFPLVLDQQNIQAVDIGNRKGLYQIQLEWEAEGKKYYTEQKQYL